MYYLFVFLSDVNKQLLSYANEENFLSQQQVGSLTNVAKERKEAAPNIICIFTSQINYRPLVENVIYPYLFSLLFFVCFLLFFIFYFYFYFPF